MFSRVSLATAALIFALGAAIYHFQIKLHPRDRLGYPNQAANPIGSEKRPAKVIQERTGIKKEIWTVKNGQRVLFRLLSKQSVLAICRANHKFELSEKLSDLNCCMQEEVACINGNLVQEIRTLDAEEGTYLYPSHTFLTDAVELKFFRLLGERLPLELIATSPYLSGHASDVTFAAGDKTLRFKAHYLKAELDPKQIFGQDL